MIVVSDTTPLRYLAELGELEILLRLFTFEYGTKRGRKLVPGRRNFSTGSLTKGVFSEKSVDSPGQIGRSLTAMALNAPSLPRTPSDPGPSAGRESRDEKS